MESTSSAGSSAGQAVADLAETPRKGDQDIFASLVNGAEAPATPSLKAATSASLKARRTESLHFNKLGGSVRDCATRNA